MRGRAFGFVAILCATWVAARIGFTLLAEGQVEVGGGHIGTLKTQSIHVPKSVSPITIRQQGTPTFSWAAKFQSPLRQRLIVERTAKLQSYNSGELIGAQPERYSADLGPLPNIIPIQFKLPTKVRAPPPIEFYAYSFLRWGDAAQGGLGNGQYGGSQSMLLVRIPLLRFQNSRSVSRLALTGRASMAHAGLHERELATGLRWRPSAAFPAELTMERRFRPNRPDAIAAFVSGGHDGAALPLAFTLDGYGQAGFVTGNDGGVFADGQLHALKPVASRRRATLAAGAGAWGGGQNDIMRLDMGPLVRADLYAGSTQLRLDASWRFRIAGDAKPGNGPALTLSTSF